MSGEPQPFDSVRQHSQARLVSRSNRTLNSAQWEQHVSGLRDLNILASQASEYLYNRNRTEGKTGLVKPDLILVAAKSVSPKRLTNEKRQDSGVGLTKMAKPSPRTSPRTSPLRLIAEELPKVVELHAEQSNGKALKIDGNASSSKVEVDSVKKEVEVVVSEFKETVKINESKKEMPKLLEKPEETKDIVKELAKEREQPKVKVEEIPKPKFVKTKSKENVMPKVNVEEIPKAVKENNNKNPEIKDIKLTETSVESLKPVGDSSPIPVKPTDAKKPVVSSRSDGAARPTLVRSKGSLIASKPPNILVFSDSAATRDSVIATLSTILEENM